MNTVKTYPEGTRWAIKVREPGCADRWQCARGDADEDGRFVFAQRWRAWATVFEWRESPNVADGKITYHVVRIPPKRPRRSVEVPLSVSAGCVCEILPGGGFVAGRCALHGPAFDALSARAFDAERRVEERIAEAVNVERANFLTTLDHLARTTTIAELPDALAAHWLRDLRDRKAGT